MSVHAISLSRLMRRFWRLTTLTWLLVLLEGTSLVAMPLVIGWAVDDLMNGSSSGLFQLAALCGLLLLVGSGRRVYDTRAYARIYRTVAPELVVREQRRKASLSRLSARSSLFREFIDFLEQSIPDILHQLINLVGTLVIIALIDSQVFLVCLASMVFTALAYGFSEKRILRLNAGANDELERQVDLLASAGEAKIRGHFKRLMDWHVKLSDLETLNFSLVWVALAFLLVLTVAIVTSSGEASFGQIVSAVMYVFGFTESVLVLPLYFQQLIRLREITTRLASSDPPETRASQEKER